MSQSQIVHHPQIGGWIGVHDEGGLLRDMFAILMVDILLDTDIPDAFVVPTQVR